MVWIIIIVMLSRHKNSSQPTGGLTLNIRSRKVVIWKSFKKDHSKLVLKLIWISKKFYGVWHQKVCFLWLFWDWKMLEKCNIFLENWSILLLELIPPSYPTCFPYPNFWNLGVGEAGPKNVGEAEKLCFWLISMNILSINWLENV